MSWMLQPFKYQQSIDFDKKLRVTRVEFNGLHSGLQLTLFVGRVFGIMPLSGLMNRRGHDVSFQLKSLYAIVYFFSFVGQTLMCIMNFYWLLENKMSLTNISNFLFYTSSAVSFAILANISRNWQQLMMRIESVESKLPPLSENVPQYCNVTMVLILAAALVEHIFSVYFGVSVARSCDPNNTAETFFHYDKPWIFAYTSYSTWKGILIEFFNIQSTFIWSYSDLLIMLISIYLTEHFKTHYRLLKDTLKRDYFPCDEFRTQHLNIVKLVTMINDTIGIYILICFGSNMYWTCTQLFYCMNPVNGIEHTVYFAYSFSFLVVRTLLVLLLAARVHTASLKPLVLLYEIPNSMFTTEVERFIGQIINIKVALSGLDFFYVTRTMILTLFGTIVTYELVLLQFNK
ncbi:hypothetical protein ACJJTC_006994 [Scirpophaga incertulas]